MGIEDDIPAVRKLVAEERPDALPVFDALPKSAVVEAMERAAGGSAEIIVKMDTRILPHLPVAYREAKKRKENYAWVAVPESSMQKLWDWLVSNHPNELRKEIGWGTADEAAENAKRAWNAHKRKAADAEAEATGAIPPAIKADLERYLNRKILKSPRKMLEFLGVKIQEEPGKYGPQWVVEVPGCSQVVVTELETYRPTYAYGEHADDRETRSAPNKVALHATRVLAAKALGVRLPEEEDEELRKRKETGLWAPPPPRKPRYGDATCQWCWGVYATNKNGTMVHHGYQRPGIGHIVGDCPGVNEQPWERAKHLVEHRLTQSLVTSENLVRTLREGRTSITFLGPGNKLMTIYPGDKGWETALEIQTRMDEFHLEGLWSTWINAVPWIRAALREWAPAEKMGMGYPHPEIVAEDYAGKPKEANR